MLETLIQRLVEHPNPSVRYLALTELRGFDPHEARVRAVRETIPDAPPVRTILDAQYPAGYWMHADLGISPRYRATVWQVLFLSQLGVGVVEPVVRSVEYLLEVNCDAVGAFHLRKGDAGRSPALTGAMLWALARIGLREDPCLAHSWLWLDKKWRARGALPSDARIWVLRASAAWGRESWIARLIPGIAFEPLDPLTFPLTHRPDALAGVEAWCEARLFAKSEAVPVKAGTCRDALRGRIPDTPDPGWPLERIPGKLWFDPGPVGAFNPWVTIRVLRVLACLDRVRAIYGSDHP